MSVMKTRAVPHLVSVALAIGVVSLAYVGCGRSEGSGGAAAFAGTTPAPEFPAGLEWLNTAAPLTLKGLRGKVVVLDFWTYGCINCMHDFPWIQKLQKDFPETLVVIGVHSAKFAEEGDTRNIREIILRYGLDYPVVNDDRFQVWNEWHVGAWPTLAIVDPVGDVVTERAGEGFYPEFRRLIAALDDEFAAKGMLDHRPLKLKLESEGLPQTVLSFPGKVRVDATGHRLFVSDTGHNRIIVAALDSGRVLAVIGSGRRGFENGDYGSAQFDHPQGTALSADGGKLYVADTGNNSLREVNLLTHLVTRLDGTGHQAAEYPPPGGKAPGVALSSPWDLALAGRDLIIAMAGCHQIWRMELDTGRIGPLAGTGAEGYEDGPLDRANLAQPSGVTIGLDGRIYVADSEGSSIRVVDLKSRTVTTLAGAGDGLFDFGSRDGMGRRARLQHPLGVVATGGKLFVADTYNNRIRVVDPGTGEVHTLAGGKAGWREGREPLFYEPGGIDAADGTLYLADTNNHSIRRVSSGSGLASTLVLKGAALLAGGGTLPGSVLRLPLQTVAPGDGALRLEVALPEGFGPNPLAPSQITVTASGGDAVRFPGPAGFTGAGPRFPMVFPAVYTPGTAEVGIELSLVYCREERAEVCLIRQAHLVAPVRVASSTEAHATHPLLDVRYTVP